MRRRTFLGGAAVASLPVAAVASVTVASPEMTPKERAEHHWNAFVEAMDDLTADYDGWMASGVSRVSSKTGDRFSQLRLDSIRMMPEKIGSTNVNIERHTPLAI